MIIIKQVIELFALYDSAFAFNLVVNIFSWWGDELFPNMHLQDKTPFLVGAHYIIFRLWADDSKLKAGKIGRVGG